MGDVAPQIDDNACQGDIITVQMRMKSFERIMCHDRVGISECSQGNGFFMYIRAQQCCQVFSFSFLLSSFFFASQA